MSSHFVLRVPHMAGSLSAFCSAVARVYAGVLFSDSPRVGGLILFATLLTPRAGALGLLAVLTAAITARAVGLLGDVSSLARPSEGFDTQLSAYGYSALYLGLGASQTFVHVLPACAVATVGATVTVLLGAGLGRWTRGAGLPVLSLPFLVVYSGALAAGHVFGASFAPLTLSSDLGASGAWPLPLWLRALAGLVWSPEPLAGIVVLVALALHGRAALLLAGLALYVPLALDRVLPLEALHTLTSALVNSVLVALGLGCWFGPSPLSFVHAVLGVVLCTLLTASLADPLGWLGAVPLSLPFSLTVSVMLLASSGRAISRRTSYR